MSADPACRAPVPPEGAVPRTCVPFAHVPAVPVVAVPYVPVPVPSGLPVLSVAGILPDRTGNVDVTRFLEEWAAGPLADKADKAVPLAAGNLASLDASGNLLDSGATPASIKAAAVAEIVAGADATMDTLKEIADILGSVPESGTVMSRISALEEGKAPAQHEHDASHITSGTLASARLPYLNASRIASGTFAAARIPDLDASKIASGTLDADRIPSLDASKIKSGTLAVARIPYLNAAMITAGTFAVARIPDLGASKITSGTLSAARLPFSVDGTLSTQGDAADAKKVGDALRSGFTEWEFSDGDTHVITGPTGVGGVWFYSSGSRHLSNTFSSEAAALSALELTFTDPNALDPYDPFTATRHLVTPTKTSQLTNDSGFMTSSDLPYALVTKTPVSGTVTLSDRAVNIVNPVVTATKEWTWADGETGTPVFSSGYWTLQNASFDTYDGPVAGSDTDTEITFAKTDTKSFYFSTTDYDYETYENVFVFNVGGEGGEEVRAKCKWSDNYGENIVESIEYDGVEYALEYPVTEYSQGSTYSGTGTVAEHVVTETTTYGPTVTLTMPQAMPGRVRDLIVRIDLSQAAGAPPVAFSGGSFEAADGKMPELVKGVNLLSFTETAAGVFAVAYKEVKPITQGGS